MLTPGIGPRFMAQNTAARRGTLRPMRHGRQNYAQCCESSYHFRSLRAPNPPSLTIDGGSYRRFPQTWGWDPIDRAPGLADEIRALFPALVEVERVEGIR